MSVPHVVILGAGISGLSLAWFLKQRHGDRMRITVLEKNMRAGGWIHTIEKEGFLFELGPHSCRSQGASATLRLIESLELENQIIVPDASAQRRYLWANKKLNLLPHSALSLLFSSWIMDVAAAVWRDLRAPVSKEEDESIYEFSTRRFGDQLTHKLIDPLVTGIYAGDMHKLSVRSCFPQWYQWERQYGSVLRGMWSQRSSKSTSALEKDLKGVGSFSFKRGMETVTRSLENKLQGQIKYGSKATQLFFQPNSIILHTSDGKELTADHVFSTVPAQALADLMANHHTIVGGLLTSMDSVTVVVVNLGYRAAVLKQKGFGYLVPQSAGEQVLGAIWDSSLFPQQNHEENETRITLMLGGAHHPEHSGLSDENLLAISTEAMKAHLGIDRAPDVAHIHRARYAIPQYYEGHVRRVEHINEVIARDFPHLTCLGTAFGGVSINDCIAQAEKYAHKHKY